MKQKAHIQFNPDNHTYRNVITDEIYMSVSKFIENYKKPFDETGSILIASARKAKIAPSELKAQWDEKNRRSKIRGSSIHKFIEDFILCKNKEERDFQIETIWQNDTFFQEIPFQYLWNLTSKRCKLHIEDLLYLDSKKLAGQSDLVLEYKNHIEIEDWKTNEKDSLHKAYSK
ncbi:MAG: hypothetical protein ACRCXN_11675, partial [Bacteroidales bacterium]